MKNLQEVFVAIKELQKEQKVIRDAYRNVLANSSAYQELIDELKTLKEKKKQMEQGFQDDMRADFTKLDGIKQDIESNQEMLSDLAFNNLVKGEKVEVVDEYENKYEPRFVVRFKKI
jgi:hypothetical protein